LGYIGSLQSPDLLSRRSVNDHPASAKELKIEEGKGERRNRETEKKGGERELSQKLGDH
jgi:hypothetical protein